jgi:hypothetical protein
MWISCPLKVSFDLIFRLYVLANVVTRFLSKSRKVLGIKIVVIELK